MIPLLILTPLILLAALGAVWKARPVHAALLLALTLALNAVLYLVLRADFIGTASRPRSGALRNGPHRYEHSRAPPQMPQPACPS